MTYSINDGTIYVSTKLNNLNDVLQQLPDNTNQEIYPVDVRDMTFTVWENIIYKPTSVGGVEYIGIDQDFIHKKVSFGKKTANGYNVMNPTLLNNDVDFYLYNTKEDNVSQTTRLGFLTGNQTNNDMGIIEYVEYNGGTGTQSNLNILNDDDIGLRSNTGHIILNGVKFPKVSATASNGNILVYNNGTLEWAAGSSTDSIISGGTVSIVGSPVLINGHPIEYTNNTPVPATIGGIQAGTTFPTPTALVEMFDRLLYPYLAPTVSVTAVPSVSEVNVATSTITLNYNVNRISPTASITGNMPNSDMPTLTDDAIGTCNGTLLVTSTATTQTWVLTVGDGISTVTGSTTHNRVYPFFYGTSTTATNVAATFSTSVLPNLTKNVKVKSSTNVMLGGTGVCIYFAYPAAHGALFNILDNNGFDVTTSFTVSTMTISAPFPTTGYWTSISYRVYIYTGSAGVPSLTTVGSSSAPVQFKFNF